MGFQGKARCRSVEQVGRQFFFEGLPASGDDAVGEDDGREVAGIVVGTVPMGLGKDDPPALVANQVLIVGREQQHRPFPETAAARIPVQEQVEAFPSDLVQCAAERFHPPPAVSHIQARPPDKIFEGGGAVAPEILICQQHKRFVPFRRSRGRHFRFRQRIGRLHREKIPAAQRPGKL